MIFKASCQLTFNPNALQKYFFILWNQDKSIDIQLIYKKIFFSACCLPYYALKLLRSLYTYNRASGSVIYFLHFFHTIFTNFCMHRAYSKTGIVIRIKMLFFKRGPGFDPQRLCWPMQIRIQKGSIRCFFVIKKHEKTWWYWLFG